MLKEGKTIMPQKLEENDIYKVSCTDSGVLLIENKNDQKQNFELHIFPERYHYLYVEWDIAPMVYFSPDLQYLIVTYGVGFVYIISLLTKKMEKSFQLFPEIHYENDSFEQIDMYCYYCERTEISFSNTGRFIEVRVRGDFDPQEEDGKSDFFTPVYFRSVFLIDLWNLSICFHEEYENDDESTNLASIAFSPDDHFFVTGALGNKVKVFDLTNGQCLGIFESLVWIPDPCGIRNCELIEFIDQNSFIFVNKENDLTLISLQENGKFQQSKNIKAKTPKPDEISNGVYKNQSYIQKIKVQNGQILCEFSDSTCVLLI